MSHDKRTAVLGIFRGRASAEDGVDSLLRAGFSVDDISLLLPTDGETREFAHEKHTKAPEGAATGATAGGVVGGTLGALVGIGALAIPGLGPFIAAGPIMATLAGVGAGGAVGGLIGALSGLGLPEYEAKRYEGFVKSGGILLSVLCDTSEQVSAAKTVLKNAGGQDISSTTPVRGEQPASHQAR